MKRWTIGNLSRHKADLGLNDETVSALQANLTQTDDGLWSVEDCNSMNGTARFVNGQWTRIRQAQVGLDDRLRFGRAETTVRQLLKSPPAAGPDSRNADVIPWTQDLVFAVSKIRDMSELKRNLLFVLDLISDPAHHAMRSVARRRPVNPFSFMVFGGIIYAVVIGFGLTIPALRGQDVAKLAAKTGPVGAFLQENESLLIVFFVIQLLFNMFPFPIFKYFTLKNRSFSDFMRVTAIVTGMSWMLTSFVALLRNEAFSATQSDKSIVLKAGVILFSVIVSIYVTAFAVIVQKHFWGITYGRTLWCYVLTALAFIPVAFFLVVLVAADMASIQH